MEEIKLLYSPHAEEAVIGSVLINPSVIDLISLQGADFYLIKLGIIWDTILELHRSGKTPDILILCDRLEAKKKLSEIGGPSYITTLIANTPSSLRAEEYAGIVSDYAQRRNVLRVASEIAQGVYQETVPLVDTVSAAIDSMTKGAGVTGGAVPWGFYLSRSYDKAEERSRDPKSVWGLETGFTDYDQITGGLQMTELLLVAGKPGIGKSRLVLQMGVQLARAGSAGAIYSLEMSGEAYATRALAAESGVETRNLKSGYLKEGDWEKFITAISDLDSLPIWMSDQTYWTTGQLRADLARLKRQSGIKWFAVDYSYLLCDGAGKLDETERTQLITANLKMICKSLGLAGIAIHSMTKAGLGSDTPSNADLRGSGQVSYDADITLFIQQYKGGNGHSASDDNLIICSFGKGRELENDKKYFFLVKLPKTPYFGNYTRSPMQPEGGKLKESGRSLYEP